MKKLLMILAVLWGGTAVGVWYWNEVHTAPVGFRTVRVERGDLLASIHATGTIEPEEVADVGAQIAGEVREFGKDPSDPSKPVGYGSHVEAGTVLVRLDDALYQARRNQEQAALERAQADVRQARVKLRQAERELDRASRLQKSRTNSASEYDTAVTERDTARASLDVALSTVAVARANLEEATVNIGYTTIRSPVRGVIIDRRVNLGQTVSASFNGPSLFLIAKDLDRLQIWASVNESDLGEIHPGQNVRFTVSAFPGESFRGKVQQVRLNATMTQGVVTYTAVVDVDNTSGRLLPYLTARLEFEVHERKGVLLVPNAALRWKPRAEQVAPDARAEFVRQTRNRIANAGASESGSSPDSSQRRQGNLWVGDGASVRPVRVTLGVTDGLMTEVSGRSLHQGMDVIVGQASSEENDAATTPFLPQIKNDKAKK